MLRQLTNVELLQVNAGKDINWGKVASGSLKGSFVAATGIIVFGAAKSLGCTFMRNENETFGSAFKKNMIGVLTAAGAVAAEAAIGSAIFSAIEQKTDNEEWPFSKENSKAD